ncbi:MAG: YqgE/AlgH family protein [Rhodospirillales bacterium]|nr:YqgE/AlgH family protein [Rhodospirillales bacterium]
MRLLRTLALVTAFWFAAGSAGDAGAQSLVPGGQGHFTRGQLLVASPKMPDGRFARTVIYMVDHDARGAFGFIVNRPMGAGPMDEFMKSLDLPPGDGGEITLHYGGPVDPGAVFVLHSAEWKDRDPVSQRGPLAVTTHPDILKAISEGHGPRRSLVIMGYAGWGARQLEGEMARDDWITAPMDFDLIFDTDAATKWERASAKAGVAL